MNEIEELEKNLEDFKNNLYTTNGLKDLLEKEINLIQEYDNKNTELLNSMENIMDKNKECIHNATSVLSNSLIAQILSISEQNKQQFSDFEEIFKNDITNLNYKIDHNQYEVQKKLKGIRIMNIFILLFCIIIIILHFYF